MVESSAHIRIYTFGTLSVERKRDDGTWEAMASSTWGSATYGSHTKSLLSYLLCCSQRQAFRGSITDELWGSDLASVDDYMQRASSRLRQILGSEPYFKLTVNRTKYTLADQSLLWVDADHCKTVLEEAKRIGVATLQGLALLQEAEYYFRRGRFLEEETGLWIHSRRGNIHTLSADCFHWLLNAYGAQGQYKQLEDLAEYILREEPINEYALCHLMTALHKRGMTSEALRRYRETATLAKKTGLVLSVEAQALAQRLQNEPQIVVLKSTFTTPSYLHNTSFTLVTDIDQGTNERLDQVESIINLAWEAWFASRPKQVTREITKLLPNLERMIYIPLAIVHILHIKELVIRCHGLLGAIHLDTLQNDSALYHYIQAYKFAEEIHNTNLTVTYLALMGEALRRQNDKAAAITYMEKARDQAANANQATLGHVLQLLAYTYSDIGNETAFEQTISEATNLLAFTGEGKDTAKAEFIPFEIYEIRGKANRDLGKPLKAIPYLELAEKSLIKAFSGMTPTSLSQKVDDFHHGQAGYSYV